MQNTSKRRVTKICYLLILSAMGVACNPIFAHVDETLSKFIQRKHTRLGKKKNKQTNKKDAQKKVKKQTSVLRCEPILVPSPCAVPFESCNDRGEHYSISKSSFKGKRNGIILDKPGTYKLTENISFRPTAEAVTAITITASNTILDLGQYTLVQKNDVRYVYGIAIARDVKNVTITGIQNQAQILDFSLAGIRVMGRTDSITIENVITSQSEPRQLTDDDIPVECARVLCSYLNTGIAVGEGGTESIIYVGTDRNNRVTNISLSGVTAKRSTNGCSMLFTFGIEIEESNFIENTVLGLQMGSYWPVFDEEDNPVFPICANGTYRNCHFDNNRGLNFDLMNPLGDPTDPDTATYWWDFISAVEHSAVTDFTIENCTVNDNYCDGFILAADHDGAHNMVWRDCVFLRNRGEFETCDGFHISGSFNNSLGPCITGKEYPFEQDVNVTIERCSSMGNSSGSGSSSGIRLVWGNGVLCSDCHASGNSSELIPEEPDEITRSAGFKIEGFLPTSPGRGAEKTTLVRCYAERNGQLGGTRSGGFYIDSDSNNVVIRDCVANGNGNNDVAGQIAGGIIVYSIYSDVVDPEDGPIERIVLDNNIVNGNGNDLCTATGGIVIVRTDDTLAAVNDILIKENTLSFNKGVGIGLYGDITNAMINDNEVVRNTSIGIDVSHNPNSVLVLRNTAYDNGSDNYAGVAAGVLVSGSTTGLPGTVGAKNLNIRNP